MPHLVVGGHIWNQQVSVVLTANRDHARIMPGSSNGRRLQVFLGYTYTHMRVCVRQGTGAG